MNNNSSFNNNNNSYGNSHRVVGNNDSSSIFSGRLILYAFLGIVAIVGIWILVKHLFKNELPGDMRRTEDDRKLVEQAFNHDGMGKAEWPPITGDIVISGKSNYNEEEHQLFIEKISDSYTAKIREMTKQLNRERPPKVIGAGLGYMLATSGAAITKRQLDTYMTLSATAADAIASVDGDCVRALADVSEKTGLAIGANKDCHTYDYVQSVEQTHSIYEENHSVHEVTNSGGSILFGLVARGKKGTDKLTVDSIRQEDKTQKIDYIPVCKGKSIDGSVLTALKSTQLDVMISIMNISANAWDRFPTAKAFFSEAK